MKCQWTLVFLALLATAAMAAASWLSFEDEAKSDWLSRVERKVAKKKTLAKTTKNKKGHKKTKQSKSGDEKEDSIEDAIAKRAADIPIEQYENDPTFLQHIDRINQFTTYKSTFDETLVYERQEADTDKEVVVLKSTEDKLDAPQSKTGKEMYVVLRRKPGEKKPTFYASYAYIR